MNAIENAIAKLTQIKTEIISIGTEMAPYAEDLKRDELRQGLGTYGQMPSYASDDYLRYKKALGTYKAAGNAYDLFVSGALAKGITAVNKDNIIMVGNSSSSPDYAYKFTKEIEGISDQGANDIIQRAGLVLTNKISKILNV